MCIFIKPPLSPPCRACAVCKRAFNDPTFVRYPNGVVTHIHCAKNKFICPVTGRLFSSGSAGS